MILELCKLALLTFNEKLTKKDKHVAFLRQLLAANFLTAAYVVLHSISDTTLSVVDVKRLRRRYTPYCSKLQSLAKR